MKLKFYFLLYSIFGDNRERERIFQPSLKKQKEKKKRDERESEA